MNIGGASLTKIYLNLENCYGIPKLNNTFEFNEKNKAHLIYAPNGVMKTSFANTLADICLDNETKDCFYPSRKTIRQVRFDDENGVELSKEDILVIESYSDDYKSENISVLLADEKLKKEYEEIHKEIDQKMGSVFSVIDQFSGKRKSQKFLVEDFGYSEKDIYDCLEAIYDNYKDKSKEKYSNIKYSELVTADAKKILDDEDVIAKLQSYINQYEQLLTKSTIFMSSFNPNNAKDALSILGKEGFFKAKHKILLDGTIKPIGEKEFSEKINEEKKRILDQELLSEFEKIDSLLAKKVGGKALRKFILENKEIIPELVDLAEFKKKIWISYLFKESAVFQEAIFNYRNNKQKLEKIIKAAEEKKSEWQGVVEQFNERFSNMPFKIEILNKDDVILKSEIPTVFFKYENRGEESIIEKRNLILHLSNGEKKALYLLNVIFEIEARKKLEKPTFLIIDDIADSFDYRNKYAIIEYIKEIVDCDLFMPIILTHNFDFYRTVAGRVGIQKNSYFVDKSDESLVLKHGEYFKSVFSVWKKQVYRQDEIFLAAIAFVRNLVEYIYGYSNPIYKNLTNLLHFRQVGEGEVKATKDITVENLCDWYNKVWGIDLSKFKQCKEQKVIELIYITAEKIISNNVNIIKIENKIVLCLAIRQKAEAYMINRIDDNLKVNNVKSNQTRELKNLIVFDKNSPNDSKIEEIIERVLIITSENIHINSFMYEPIVDMSLEELIKLYNDIKDTLN